MYNSLKIINFKHVQTHNSLLWYQQYFAASQAVGTEDILISDHCVCFEAELSRFFFVNILIDVLLNFKSLLNKELKQT